MPPAPQHNSKAIGQGMIAVGFIIGIVLLTFVFDNELERQINPNQDPDTALGTDGATEVFLQRNRQGHYVMTGTVNNVEVDFILDTGATDVVIPDSVAEAAGLTYGNQSRAMTANGLVTTYMTVIDELQLSSITLENVRASINPAMDDSIVLLGMSALQQIEFVQRGSQLTLRHYRN